MFAGITCTRQTSTMTRLGFTDQGAILYSEEPHLVPYATISRSFLLKDMTASASFAGHVDLPLHQDCIKQWLCYVEGHWSCGVSSIGDLCVLAKVCPCRI